MKRFIDTIKDFIKGMSKHPLDCYAASTAYFTFVCFIPFLLLVISIIPYTPIEKAELVSMIYRLLPDYVHNFALGVVENLFTESIPALSFSIVVLIFTSSRAVVSVRKGLNDIDECKDKKNFILVRLFAFVFTMLLIVALVLISTISLFGRMALSFVKKYNIFLIDQIRAFLDFDTVLTLLGFFIVFAILYSLLPSRKHGFKYVYPGAIFSSAACLIYSRVFNFISINVLSFSMYGSLATIIILIMYLYFFFYVFFVGAYLNKFIWRNR
ncbi:MAG: YihY/virulence factor BrkB family protein [Erysipelotrichaceae bacterium]|nr:YihY/virulence factor BrkB family protein [Erysipelotrichaceae bacterium]